MTIKPFKEFIHYNPISEIVNIAETFNSKVCVKERHLKIYCLNSMQVRHIIQFIPNNVEYHLKGFEHLNIKSLPDHLIDLTLVISLCDHDEGDIETLNEVKRRIKVNAKGKRTIKMQCKKGYKWNGTSCTVITGREKQEKRISTRKAVKTKKQKGTGFNRRMTKKRNKALRRRKGMGL